LRLGPRRRFIGHRKPIGRQRRTPPRRKHHWRLLPLHRHRFTDRHNTRILNPREVPTQPILAFL